METNREPIPFAGCFGAVDSRIVFVGLPDDSQSSFRRGAARGPTAIRTSYDGLAYNATSESGVDLEARVTDLGDWPVADDFAATARDWTARAARLFGAGRVPFFAGGDHAVTVPVVAALAFPVHVVQIDAHPDLYPEFEGSRESHACVAARLLEMEHVVSLTQIGVRTWNDAQRDVADRHADRIFTDPGHLTDTDAVYLTIDLDGIDPAFAPGVAHTVPGGLSSREAIDRVHSIGGRLIGMDVVELNPDRDEGERTAILAARLLHEGMARAAASR